MSSLDHKLAIRLLPERCSANGARFFCEYVGTAEENATPVVISLQRRLIHKGNPGGSSSCYVNLPDAPISPILRCVARRLPGQRFFPRAPFAAAQSAAFF